MVTQTISGPMTPTANIAVNKSRIKLYKNTDIPTYYLQNGQEFSIELFNPTQENILAKITLNNKQISQGGLVLRPGERVFLERYLDVAKKFLFETYEVSNTSEVQKAIEKNGDFKVEFFKEKQQPIFFTTTGTGTIRLNGYNNLTTLGSCSTSIGTSALGTYTTNAVNTGIGISALNNSSGNITNTSSTNVSNSFYNDSSATMDWMAPEMERTLDLPKTRSASDRPKEIKCSSKKTVETGRVEKGSNSDQKIKQVQMDFEFYPFHTFEAKMLPISQKINTTNDINVRQYCTNCGHKASKGDNFCSSCGKKI